VLESKALLISSLEHKCGLIFVFSLTSGKTHFILFIDRGGEKPEIIPFEPDPGNAGGGRE
jgi:hypothetical protein